jgi:hypothetical protein
LDEEVSDLMSDLNFKDTDDYFSVVRGNVVFASSVDGWAFRYRVV